MSLFRSACALFLVIIALGSSATRAAVAEADFAKLAALMQANKDAEARALFAELLTASPNDPQLLTLAKQFEDKVRPTTAADLRGAARVDYAATEELLREAVKPELSAAQREAGLLEYLDQTAVLLVDYPGLTALWVKRAGLALELNLPAVGREAGAKLLALGAADTGDERTIGILAGMKLKGWLKPAAVGSAAEAGTARTIALAPRRREFQAALESLSTLLADAARSSSDKQSSWDAFLRKWSIRDDGGPADAGRVRDNDQGAALVENEAMRRQAEERRLAEERQRAEVARIAAAAEAERLEQLRQESLPKRGKNYVLKSPALDLIWVSPGIFRMGREDGFGDEKPVLTVTLSSGFWLGKTEVTQAQWQAVMGRNPSHYKGDDLPVENVSWEDARAFCQRLTTQERAAGRLPSGYTYCLPTEAEWEYACRAGTSGDYAGELSQMAWYDSNAGRTTHVVGTKQANAWGLYDMHGNVSEWCADWFGQDYSGYPSGTAVTNPIGRTSGSQRVLRGGALNASESLTRSSTRSADKPDASNDSVGFRLALSSVRGTSQ